MCQTPSKMQGSGTVLIAILLIISHLQKLHVAGVFGMAVGYTAVSL